ncbi:MAG TPA: 4Fe-4S ferredoxin, partial [Burkholderiaceae bacterium]|nr:4Fe-4S ferredoxin [Burkholderiaceae bacterium]
AIAQQPGARATLSYRGEAFNRVKEKNRTQLEQARAAGELKVLQPSSVERIEADRVHLVYQGKPVVIRNDDVVVCAGGELPTELLKKVGVLFQTHRGAT